MDDLAARGAPLEYWFFRTDSEDLSFRVRESHLGATTTRGLASAYLWVRHGLRPR